MKGQSTRHSIARLWTGILTLLLISDFASLQEATALNETITESPSESVAPLHKVYAPSTTLNHVGDALKASVKDTIDDKSLDNFTTKSNGSQDEQRLSDSKSEKFRIEEPLTKVAKIKEKRASDPSLQEFSENEDNGELDDEEGDNDREPTTPSPKKEVDNENQGPKDPKQKGKKTDSANPEETVPKVVASLANDTNVNYNIKKSVKSSKDEGALDDDSNSLNGTLRNATNVTASGTDAADTKEITDKGPKAQVEVGQSSTLSKLLRFSEARIDEERKEVDGLGSAKQESIIETSESTGLSLSKDLANATEKTSNFTLPSEDYIDDEKGNGTKVLRNPKARTMVFDGTNVFAINDNTTGWQTGHNEGIATRPTSQIVTGVTTETVEDNKNINVKPYPYAKTNSSEVSSSGNGQVSRSSEESSALENTIGRKEENKKFVVTEPSLVIDNSIQQFKPVHYKRAGNSSILPTRADSTTVPSLEGEGQAILSTESIPMKNDTTVFVASLAVSNTENDVPQVKDETAKSRFGAKDTSGSLDLTGNGITEVIARIKNDSLRDVMDFVTTVSIPLTTSSISMPRAIENTTVQNSTEKIATNIQDDPNESMLNILSFNVTERSTKMTSNQRAINVAASTPSTHLSTSTFIPEISSKSNLTESSLTLMAEMSSMSNSSSMISSVSISSSTSPSVLSNPTFPNRLNTKLGVEAMTVAPNGSTDGLSSKPFKPAKAISSVDPVESTTSKVEYVFVGLTESTDSQQHMTSPKTLNALNLDTERASSTPSSVIESSTLSSRFAIASTTIGASSNDSESTVTSETPELISTEPVKLITENYTNQDSTTTASTLEFTTLEDSTVSIEENIEESAGTVEDTEMTLTNEYVETVTNESTVTVNSTDVPGIIPDIDRNTADTGHIVDSSTANVPEVTFTGVENSTGTIIGSAEATTPSMTTEVSELPDVPKISWTNLTSGNSSDNSMSDGSRINATSKSPSSNSILRTSSTKPATSSTKPDVSTTTGDTVSVVSDGPIDVSSRGVVSSLVKVIFEGSWADVCPHLDVLRQSLADLLTTGLEKTVLARQIMFQRNPCSGGFSASTITTELSATTLLLYVVDENGNFNGEITKTLPNLYSKSPIKLQVNIRSFQLVQDSDSANAIAVVVVSCVALICLVLLAGLLFIMRKRQTRFNYGERCRPVSLDAYSLDSISAYNSVRRKGAASASKRSYGNPTFDDSSTVPSHPLNFAGLSNFCNERNAIYEEFASIPQVTARIDELPQGVEFKNRYANVVPLPETRVSLMKINNDPLTEYINASYIRGPKNSTKHYIACQAPIESTITDFWRMIWEQQSKVIIMLTDLVENGVEKCAEYIPPSEVTDCHRLFGDFQITLKKREAKEKYAISMLHLKNLENNTFREISHIWYLWAANGVQSDATGLIAVLLEARALQRGGPGPIVVHCSPGTGRTGTLVALDLGIRQYEITRTVDVPRVVYTIRRDRAGAVQTKEQYAFIYKALNLYANKLAGGALES